MKGGMQVVDAFLGLKVEYQGAIAEVTRQMGQGMAEFITKEVHTLKDYNRYCYYVAGLVGVGLSRLFAAGGVFWEMARERATA